MLFEIIYCDGEMTNDDEETQGGQIHIAPVLLLAAGLKFAQKSSTAKEDIVSTLAKFVLCFVREY